MDALDIINNKSGVQYENGIWKGVKIEIPKNNYKVNESLFKQMKHYSKNIAQIDGITGYEDSYANLTDRSIKCALWMRKQGVQPGDVIGICTHNQLDTAIPLIASLFIGAVSNPWWETCLDEDVIKYFIELTEPKLIFINEQSSSIVQNVINKLNRNIKIIALGNVDGVESLTDILNTQNNNDEIDHFKCTSIDKSTHPALLIYTSGSTGRPKSVLLSCDTLDQNINKNDDQISDCSTGIWFSSLCWVSAITCLLTSISIGSKYVVYPNPSELTICQLIEKYQINWAMIGTGVANRLYKTKQVLDFDFSSIKRIYLAGAIAKREIEEFLVEICPNALVIHCYGCTEAGSMVTVTPVSSKPCSCGKVLPNIQMKVINPENGDTLGINEEGEICIKTSKMMLGYYKNPKATDEVIDADGWYHTDDLGYFDEDGDLFIIDRIKDLIKCRLDDIAPGPIEQCILKHPNVAEVAVVSKPYGIDREQPMAFITMLPGTKVTEAEIIKLVDDKLPLNMRLSGGVKILDKMLYTPSGKIAKKNLRNLARVLAQEN
ncbi:4-coumarate-CoA ligase 1-like isoform X2 [Aphidius gifuensis]|uniref:4-coumarate-CoA ligase 1-like isoform X2 n=1 Tax=Aphidius gifuensis TaxID=684658 RepID=UPI001CDB4FFF|nr:4-coumarate-CoA ligase 1-like isoform X2 [Aphidius gifuensis]